MFDRRVVNGVALALVILFLIQSAYDIVSVDYEVPAGMYGIITIVVSAVVGTAVGVSLTKRKQEHDKLSETHLRASTPDVSRKDLEPPLYPDDWKGKALKDLFGEDNDEGE